MKWKGKEQRHQHACAASYQKRDTEEGRFEQTHLVFPKITSLTPLPPQPGTGAVLPVHKGGLGLCSKGQLSAASPPSGGRPETPPAALPPPAPPEGAPSPAAIPSSRPVPSRCAEGSAAAAGTYRRRARSRRPSRGSGGPAVGMARASPAVGVCWVGPAMGMGQAGPAVGIGRVPGRPRCGR